MRKILAFGVMVGVVVGCGGSDSGSAKVTPNFRPSSTSRKISMEVFQDPFRRWLAPRATDSTHIGQTTSASLTSLQYYIQSIQLCNSITHTGSGYSSTSGCAYLYHDSGTEELDYYNTYTVTEAQDDTTHYVDFMDPDSVATLNRETDMDAGTYNYALINFMRPIKIKAEFKDAGGTTRYYTKSGGTIVDGGLDDGGRQIEYVNPNNTTTAPAELMTYMLNNGGTIFPFLSPFVVANGESVTLDFVFNPENFASAFDNPGCSGSGSTQPVFDYTNCTTLDMPYAKMAPVPRKSGEGTRKEVYLVDLGTGTALSKTRVELYYNDADSAKTIRGVDTAVVMSAGATVNAGNIVGSYRVTETDGVVSFFGYNQNTGAIDAETLTGITRRQDGTATYRCYYSGTICAAADGSAITKAYTYEGDVAIE